MNTLVGGFQKTAKIALSVLFLGTSAASAETLDLNELSNFIFQGVDVAHGRAPCHLVPGPIRRDVVGRQFQEYSIFTEGVTEANFRIRYTSRVWTVSPSLDLSGGRQVYSLNLPPDLVLEMTSLRQAPADVKEYTLSDVNPSTGVRVPRIACRNIRRRPSTN
jgi:hypothetical protein